MSKKDSDRIPSRREYASSSSSSADDGDDEMSEQTMTNENSTVDLPALADDDTATPSEPIPQLDEHVTKIEPDHSTDDSDDRSIKVGVDGEIFNSNPASIDQDDNKTEPPTTVADIDKADSSLNIEETPEIQKQDETAVTHVTPEYRAEAIADVATPLDEHLAAAVNIDDSNETKPVDMIPVGNYIKEEKLAIAELTPDDPRVSPRPHDQDAGQVVELETANSEDDDEYEDADDELGQEDDEDDDGKRDDDEKSTTKPPDEDVHNPAYIPKAGRFYMHDLRTSDSEPIQDSNVRPSRADVVDKWQHDRFDDRDQKHHSYSKTQNNNSTRGNRGYGSKSNGDRSHQYEEDDSRPVATTRRPPRGAHRARGGGGIRDDRRRDAQQQQRNLDDNNDDASWGVEERFDESEFPSLQDSVMPKSGRRQYGTTQRGRSGARRGAAAAPNIAGRQYRDYDGDDNRRAPMRDNRNTGGEMSSSSREFRNTARFGGDRSAGNDRSAYGGGYRRARDSAHHRRQSDNRRQQYRDDHEIEEEQYERRQAPPAANNTSSSPQPSSEQQSSNRGASKRYSAQRHQQAPQQPAPHNTATSNTDDAERRGDIAASNQYVEPATYAQQHQPPPTQHQQQHQTNRQQYYDDGYHPIAPSHPPLPPSGQHFVPVYPAPPPPPDIYHHHVGAPPPPNVRHHQPFVAAATSAVVPPPRQPTGPVYFDPQQQPLRYSAPNSRPRRGIPIVAPDNGRNA